MDSIENEIRALLYNFWITKEDDKDLYYQIKSKQNKIRDFVSKNLGSNLIVHDKFIKLEKIPTIIKGISSNFTSVLEYVILSIILLFLEDKPSGDYFILSDLIEYIKNTAITLELNNIPDWNKTQDRRCLFNVISFLESLKVIKVKDSSKVSFIESIDAEALYETFGVSNYLMRMFDDNINELKTPDDFIKNEFGFLDEEKGDVKRYKVFRNILYTPAVSSIDLSFSELDYIKRNRNYIKNEIDKFLNMNVEITQNLVVLYDEESNNKENFPNSKKLTDIILIINKRIMDDIYNKKIILDEREVGIVKESYFENLIKDIKKDKKIYIGKTLLNESDKKFYDMVIDYMSKYNFIEKKNDEIIIYPTISRLVGLTNKEENKTKQISLFGGNDEL